MDNSEHGKDCICAWREVERQNAEMRAAKEKADDRLPLTTGSADVVDQLKRLSDDWFARAVDEMVGAVKEKNARDGMNFYQHTARAAVLSECRKQLMEIILPNSELSQPKPE